MEPLTLQQIRDLHIELHQSLDKLIACFVSQTERHLTDTTVMEFMEWSHSMLVNPTCYKPPEATNDLG